MVRQAQSIVVSESDLRAWRERVLDGTTLESLIEAERNGSLTEADCNRLATVRGIDDLLPVAADITDPL